jgi:hypothetical protein
MARYVEKPFGHDAGEVMLTRVGRVVFRKWRRLSTTSAELLGQDPDTGKPVKIYMGSEDGTTVLCEKD